jgi:hypothetical protein
MKAKFTAKIFVFFLLFGLMSSISSADVARGVIEANDMDYLNALRE